MPKERSHNLLGVEISNPAKLLFSTDKVSKLDVARYYAEVAPFMLEEIKNRPLMLLRCPQGKSKTCFYQKHFDESDSKLKTVLITEQNGSREPYVYVEKERDIIELVQRNTIEFHSWGSRVPSIDQPDRMIFDLDPAPEVKASTVSEMALSLRDFLKRYKLESFARLSGGKGIHIVIPISTFKSWEECAQISQTLASLFSQKHELATLEISKQKRKGKIFVDYLRNARGSTCICNYSLRARTGAPAAVPVRWEEIDAQTRFNQFNMAGVIKRLKTDPNPWGDFNSHPQIIPQIIPPALEQHLDSRDSLPNNHSAAGPSTL